MLRVLVTAVAAFAGVLVVLLAGVGQLGKIDTQTLVVVLVVAAAAAGVAAWRARRS